MSQQAKRRAVPELPDLLERGARGDQQAFARLYDATAPRAYGLALRVLGDRGMAEEVTQEAYVDVWRQSDRYDRNRASVDAWLLTIVHRRAVDRVRSTRVWARSEEAYRRQATTQVDVDATSVSAMASLDARRVRGAMAELSPLQRQAISLAYFDGLTYAEVAEVVDAPLGTVKSRIRAGLLRLRCALDQVAPQAT